MMIDLFVNEILNPISAGCAKLSSQISSSLMIQLALCAQF
jgi:hypothetical protein